MKKTAVIGLLMGIISIPTAAAMEFSDVPNDHPDFVSITQLVEQGILKGYDDGTFKPEKIVNRAEAIKVILGGSNISVESELEEAPFTDTLPDQWFAPFVMKAKQLGVVNGNPDGSFAPSNEVKRVEFIKMLLETNRFKKEKWENQQHFDDVPGDSWYASYMNYAGKSGLVIADSNNQLNPEQAVTRGEMAEILYLMRIILNGRNANYLIGQSELQMAQIETYIGAKKIAEAKRAAELAFDLTQQALIVLPENNVVLGAAKIAKAYDLLIDAFIAGVQQNKEKARELAEQAKVKATEGWEANNDVQAIARHIKDRADEILSQL